MASLPQSLQGLRAPLTRAASSGPGARGLHELSFPSRGEGHEEGARCISKEAKVREKTNAIRQLLIPFPRKGPPGPRRVASRDSCQACWPSPGRSRFPPWQPSPSGKGLGPHDELMFSVSVRQGLSGKSGSGRPGAQGPPCQGQALFPSLPCPPQRAALLGGFSIP